MYCQSVFRESRVPVLAAFIRQVQFSTLVTSVKGELTASHIPMVVKVKGDNVTLHGHVAIGNELWKSVGPETTAMAIFLGPHAYVSPSWYATKQEHGKVVPTWNYLSVQASGRLSIIQDGEWLLSHINDLTAQNENTRDLPWSVSDAPSDFIKQLSLGIVGLSLEVTKLEGVWKLSQNRGAADRTGAIDGLRTTGDSNSHQLAAIMADQLKSS